MTIKEEGKNKITAKRLLSDIGKWDKPTNGLPT